MITVVDCYGRLAFRREYGEVTETVVLGEAEGARVALILATKAEPACQTFLEVFCSCLDLVPTLAENRSFIRHVLH